MSNEQKVTRRLIAILSADVKGYSLLMADDEVHTIQTLKTYRSLMSNLIQQHSGRVVDNPGDNLLAEFGSAVNAVDCAVKIQDGLKKENAKFVEDKRLQFRIGVNIGDIVQDSDRIYGSGVNVAARIEGIAEPGGICISRNAYDHVKDKLDLGFEYLGEHEVKNIKEPVRVYKILFDIEPPKLFVEEKLELPNKPSIAVLPFDNMSGDPSQEYFSDGLTEQIITGISKIPSIFVIARNSTFTYKGKAIKVQQVAQELGVRYVLEGSVQKSGSRVRINAQLIDATTGHHLWAESYDRVLEDIFAIQDDITIKLMEALPAKLIPGGLYRHYEGQTVSINAYIRFLQGLEYFYRMTASDNFDARKCFEETIAMDQNYSLAYTMLAYTHLNDIYQAWSKSPLESFEQAEKTALKALSIDDSLDLPHVVLSQIYLFSQQHDKSIKYGEKAVALNPNNPLSFAMLALVYYFSGRSQEAVPLLDKAFRLNPTAPFFYYHFLGHTHFSLENYKKAIQAYKKAIDLNPNFIFPRLCLAMCYIETDHDDKAHEALASALKIDPKYSLDKFTLASPHKDPSNTEKLISLLRKSGLK
jgi:adenylate cyclase